MANTKQFLDKSGVDALVELLKAYADSVAGASDASLAAVIADAAANKAAIAKLNGAATDDGSVKKEVADAVAALVNDAPEALDTLKEIATWIAGEDGEVALTAEEIITKVTALENGMAANDLADASLAERVEALEGDCGCEAIPVADIRALFD